MGLRFEAVLRESEGRGGLEARVGEVSQSEENAKYRN